MTALRCLIRHKWSPEMPVTGVPIELGGWDWVYRVCQRCGRDWAYPKAGERGVRGQ
jgi:hypothetical protein